MKNRYKIILSNRKVYKEIEMPMEVPKLVIGTDIHCDVRLRKELFFEQFELLFKYENGKWQIICSENVYVTTDNILKLLTKELIHGDEIQLKYQESDADILKISFMIDFEFEKNDYERCIDISEVDELYIGGTEKCQIYLNNPYVGKDYIVMRKQKGGYLLEERNTKYGVYVNDIKRTGKIALKEGDFVALANYSFYLKGRYLYTSRKSNAVVNGLNVYNVAKSKSQMKYPMFNRNTRIKSVIETEKIEVQDPSASPQKPKGNIVLQLLPALAMLAVTVFVRGAMNSSSNNSFIIISVCTMSIGILTSVFGIISEKRNYKRDVEQRVKKYNEYIASKEQEIQKYRHEEAEILENKYYSLEKEIKMVDDFSPDLFNRDLNDEDYLQIRLGTGVNEAQRKVEFKKQDKYDCEDSLTRVPENVAGKYKEITNTPITLSLKGKNSIGIIGERKALYGILKNITLDLTTRHYYTDVNLFYVIDEERKNQFHWIRLLPHVRNTELGNRNIVCDLNSKNVLFEYLYKELSRRMASKERQLSIVVFVYDDMGIKKHPISDFLNKSAELNVYFIFFEEYIELLPSGCSDIVKLQSDSRGDILSTEDYTKKKGFAYNVISDVVIERIVQKLAPIYCEEVSLEGSLTKNITLFELFDILSVDDIKLEENWKNSQVYKSMAAPLGVNAKNEIVYLDLNEKNHGPHGLVAGTTGSGKSEILQTFILSAATFFHPYEVAFVIIDFKGGGMVNQFADLPHLVGAITNIDGKEINRSLKSIKAELLKRQSLFAEAGVNHIDKYIKAYKEEKTKIALPHLIIIVDEFAELKAEQPEFMKELISAARIGRSLGVHLILATQKPAGQVNEQIWSNSKFKLCLKVQDQEDSKEVLKSPLAAEIKEPGRAYLQVGNNEIFELFQSAYSGAPAYREDETSQRKFKIFNMDIQGRRSLVYEKKSVSTKKESITELESIVKHIADYCEINNILKLPNICLPSLQDEISYKSLQCQCEKNMLIPIGIYDDPDHQYQGIYWTDIGKENTLVVGSSQTGKTNFLQLSIRHLVENNTPEEVVFYILDFGSMILKNFEKLKHVGGVVLASEDEKLKNFFKLINQEIDIRKNKLMNTGVSSYVAYKEAGYSDLPKIYVFLDNFTAFKELYMDTYEQLFVRICREGISLGISVVITNTSATGIGYRHMTNFSNRICFTCNDSSEYSAVLDRCRMEPKNVAGRLLFQLDKEIYEAQSFLAFDGEKEIDRANEVKEFVAKSNAKYAEYEQAKQIPAIPNTLYWKDFEKHYEDEEYSTEIPLGLNFANIEPVYLLSGEDCELAVVSKKKEKVATFIKGLLNTVTKRILKTNWNVYIIDDVERNLSIYKDNPFVTRYCIDPSESELIFECILDAVRENKEKVIELGLGYRYTRNLVIINNKDCIDYISKTKPVLDKYKELVDKYKNYGVQLILSGIENAAVPYSGPEVLKRVKEGKKAIILDSLSTIKVFEIPSGIVRSQSKQLLDDEAFYLYGSDIARIKLIKEE